MLKIAHFCIFAPHASGQYSTVKDLILAERQIGIEAEFIDYGTDKKGTVREGLVDGDICTAPLKWALNEADIIIRHTSIPPELYKIKPVILAMHGRPESSFKIEQLGKAPIISIISKEIKEGRYKAIFTFWSEYVDIWEYIYDTKIHYVPPLVDFNEYTPDGEKHDFGQFKAGINLVIADMWRDDTTPFNLIFAAQYFKDHYYPDSKLHLYGVPLKENTCFNFLAGLQKNGVIGEVGGVIGWLPKVYRAADMVLTPNIIATRVVREASATGIPIVAPHGCPYTLYPADPRDYKTFAASIKACYDAPVSRKVLRDEAFKLFNPESSAKAVKKLCEEVLISTPVWNAMSIGKDDWGVLENFIKAKNIKKIVEFGAGVSTQLFGDNGTQVTSFETMPEIIEKTRKKVPNATFELWDGKSIPEIKGDMAFIDGPQHGQNREVPYRAVVESNIPFVACHDICRQEDRQWVDKYFSDWYGVVGANNLLILRRPNV